MYSSAIELMLIKYVSPCIIYWIDVAPNDHVGQPSEC